MSKFYEKLWYTLLDKVKLHKIFYEQSSLSRVRENLKYFQEKKKEIKRDDHQQTSNKELLKGILQKVEK